MGTRKIRKRLKKKKKEEQQYLAVFSRDMHVKRSSV